MNDVKPFEPQVATKLMKPVWGAVKAAVDDLDTHGLFMAPSGSIAVCVDGELVLAAAFNEGTAHTLPTAIAMAEGKGKPEDHPKEFVGRRTHDSVIVGFAMLGGSYDPAIITFAMMLTRAQLDEEAWRKSRAEERETTASAGGRYVVIS